MFNTIDKKKRNNRCQRKIKQCRYVCDVDVYHSIKQIKKGIRRSCYIRDQLDIFCGS